MAKQSYLPDGDQEETRVGGERKKLRERERERERKWPDLLSS
jgi:hypothetical protein